jgi:integrase/recombinase XerD
MGKRIQKLVELAGIPKQISLHSLRHSIATHLLQGGMPLEQISRFLGHTSLDSTQVYTRLAEEIHESF